MFKAEFRTTNLKFDGHCLLYCSTSSFSKQRATGPELAVTLYAVGAVQRSNEDMGCRSRNLCLALL